VNTALIIGAAALVVVVLVLLLAKGWVRTAAKGGEDKSARKQLEEMARREKEASRIKSRPVPSRLATQLERLRARLGRNRD
jgi:hypothetical protein